MHGRIGVALREEPVGDSSLIEYLDRARMHTARARAQHVLAAAALDNRDIDIRERQLGGQHESRRSTSGNHHCVFGHRQLRVVS
jgi:hypothetical protein